MADVQCFMLDALHEAELSFRRFHSVALTDTQPCPLPPGYHDASRPWKRLPDEPREDGVYSSLPNVSSTRLIRERYGIEPNDPRWPEECRCGYVFTEDDTRQISVNHLWKRRDSAEVMTLRDAPAGAMWYADWYWEKGPDGHSLCVRCPMPEGTSPMMGDWLIDGQSGSGGYWTREGDPPKITARPSIGIGKNMALYHGFLTNGVLSSV